MKDFLTRLRAGAAKFMQGRRGADEFGLFTLIAAVVLSVLASVLGSGLMELASLALYVYTLVRMFSRNVAKRAEENRRYIARSEAWKTQGRQFVNRQKNRRDYKYFKCPQCHALIRLRRGTGEVDITCPRCQHRFKQSA